MKKVFAFCCFCVLFSLPATAGAATAAYTDATSAPKPDKIGIYVTPKLVYSNTVMDKIKGEAHVTSGGSNAGVSSKSRKDDNTWGGAIAIGYDFERMLDFPMRGEIEYAFFGNVDGKTSKRFSGGAIEGRGSLKNKMDIQTLFFNAYFDFKNDYPVTPYIGGGLGIAFVDSRSSGHADYTLDGESFSGSSSTNYKLNTNFAWNVGAGVVWEMTDTFALDLGYRFAGLGKAKSGRSSYEGIEETISYKSKVEDIYMHQIMLGLRVTF